MSPRGGGPERFRAGVVSAALLLAGAGAAAACLFDAFLAPSVGSRAAGAAAQPWSWRAGWASLSPGLVALAIALSGWARRVLPSWCRAAGVALPFAALVADLAGIALLASTPERGVEALRTGVLLSAGAATGLWTLAILLPVLATAFSGPGAVLAAFAVASNGALSAAVFAASDPAGFSPSILALTAAAFVSAPALLLALGRRPPASRTSSDAPNEYRIVSRWRVRARPEELCAVFLDTAALSRWWRAVFLDVVELRAGDDRGQGRLVRIHTKGWLPYTLRLDAEVVSCDPDRGIVVRTTGDLEGLNVCSLEPRGDRVRLRFDWRVRAHKPIVRRFSFLLKPLFSWNHRWVMRQGRRGLDAELRRRRGTAPLASVPRPTFRFATRSGEPRTTSPVVAVPMGFATGLREAIRYPG